MDGVSVKFDKRNKFVVVEQGDSYVICHKTGVTLEEAFGVIMTDLCFCGELDEEGISLKCYDLEANEYGIGLNVIRRGGQKTKFYILDEEN